MNEGKFLKSLNGERGNMYVRKGGHVPSESFHAGFDELQEEILSRSSMEALKVKQFEIEKDEDDIRVINRAVDGVRGVLKSFGAEEAMVSSSLVHLVEPEYFNRKDGDLSGTTGGADAVSQVVVVEKSRLATRSKIAIVSFHELMHHASFQRVGVVQNTEESGAEMLAVLERNGFNMAVKKDPQKMLFYYLTEMVVEKLTKEFVEKIRTESDFKEEFDYIEEQLAERGESRPWGGYMEVGFDDTGKEIWHLSEAYKEEVERFEGILSEMATQNPQFASSEEVFYIFVRGLLSGRLLEIARLLEKTYGKGAFRKLGEMTARTSHNE